MQKKWLRWVKWILLIYAVVGIGMYYLQDYIFFRAVPLKKSHQYHFDRPFREVNIPYSANVNLNIIQFEAAQPFRGVVLYFHGNRKNISWYANQVDMFTEKGYEVWMPDYPGYGKSTGKLTEELLYGYSLQLYKLAARNHPADSIIVYGKSMGTGLATYLASQVPCKRVILETPYYSLSSLAAHFFPIYPMERMTKVKLPSWEYLGQTAEPVTIFHGTSDPVIPYSHASRLKPLLKPGDEFVTIPGGSHNHLRNFTLFRRKLDSLLKL